MRPLVSSVCVNKQLFANTLFYMVTLNASVVQLSNR